MPVTSSRPIKSQFDRLRIGDLDPNLSIWRYFTFPKFISLLATGALWFSKLATLEDVQEGLIPEPARSQMRVQSRIMEDWFQDENLKEQVRRFEKVDEEDGRELIVANCWFIGEHENEEMWRTYASGLDSVVIRSTASCLANSLAISHKLWWMGRVAYVDLTNYLMSPYEAGQAHLRAFLKSENSSFENELRVATMNMVAPGCLNPDGSPQTEQQRTGLVYSEGRPGILVMTKLPLLIQEVRTAPSVSAWHFNLINLLLSRTSIDCAVKHSELG